MGVREMYLSDGNVKGSHYVLTIMEDGSLNLMWYMGVTKILEKNPIISKKCNGTIKIEYGVPNLLGTRQALDFIDETGNLSERWTKIK